MKPIAREIVAEIVHELYGNKILSNLTRPLYVERLLVRLLKGRWQYVGGDWSGWDLEETTSNLRIEVKQSAARQTWTDGPFRVGKPTKPIFDIRERTGYYENGGSRWVDGLGRPADLYIFAWHPGFAPKEYVDHTDPEQWEFYLLPERRLPTKQRTIGLNGLKKLNPIYAQHDSVADAVQALGSNLQPLKWSLRRAT